MLLHENKKDEVFEHTEEILETISEESFKEGWVCSFDLQERKAVILMMEDKELIFKEFAICDHFRDNPELLRAECELVISKNGLLIDAIVISPAPKGFKREDIVFTKKYKKMEYAERSFFYFSYEKFEDAMREAIFGYVTPLFSEDGLIGFTSDDMADCYKWVYSKNNLSYSSKKEENEDVDNVLF